MTIERFLFFTFSPFRDYKKTYLVLLGKQIERVAVQQINTHTHTHTHLPRSDYLLCCVFVNSSQEVLTLVEKNIVLSRGNCQWSIIAYAGNDTLLHEFSHQYKDVVTHWAYFREESRVMENSPFPRFVPKALMYPLIVHLLPRFRWVWFLDQDISLDGFNSSKLLDFLVNKLQKQNPLIMQPCLHENTQWVPTFSSNYWYHRDGRSKHKDAVGGRVGFIEQQMPIFETIFFSWYLNYVIFPLQNVTTILRSNWGIESLWCR